MRKKGKGAVLEAGEADNWQSRAVNFVRKRKAEEMDSAEKKSKDKRLSVRIPRLATYDWLLAVHNSMMCALG